MSCKDIEEYLAEYADGLLSETDGKKVTEHLARCETCAGELDLAHFSKKALRELPPLELPEGLVDGILRATLRPIRHAQDRQTEGRLEDRLSFSTRLSRFFSVVPAPAFALALVAIVAGVVVLRMPGMKDGLPLVPMEAAPVTVEEREEKPPASHSPLVPETVEAKKTAPPKVAAKTVPPPGVKSLAKERKIAFVRSRAVSPDHPARGGAGTKAAGNGTLAVASREGFGASAVAKEDTLRASGGVASAPRSLSDEGAAPRRERQEATSSLARVPKEKGDVVKKMSFAWPSASSPLGSTGVEKNRGALLKAAPISTGADRRDVSLDQPPHMEEISTLETKPAAKSRQDADKTESAEAQPEIVNRFERTHSGWIRAQKRVIRTPAALASLWRIIWATRADPPQPPPVDFSRQIVVAVSLGSLPTGGHGVRIVSVSRRGNELLVRVVVRHPAPGGLVTQVLTQPYSLVVVDLGETPPSGLKVRFVE